MRATIGECMALGSGRLRDAGVPQPRAEARRLLAHMLDIDVAVVIGHPERAVPDRDSFLALVDRRARGTPHGGLGCCSCGGPGSGGGTKDAELRNWGVAPIW